MMRDVPGRRFESNILFLSLSGASVWWWEWILKVLGEWWDSGETLHVMTQAESKLLEHLAE